MHVQVEGAQPAVGAGETATPMEVDAPQVAAGQPTANAAAGAAPAPQPGQPPPIKVEPPQTAPAGTSGATPGIAARWAGNSRMSILSGLLAIPICSVPPSHLHEPRPSSAIDASCDQTCMHSEPSTPKAARGGTGAASPAGSASASARQPSAGAGQPSASGAAQPEAAGQQPQQREREPKPPEVVNFDSVKEVMDALRSHHAALAATLEAVLTEIGASWWRPSRLPQPALPARGSLQRMACSQTCVICCSGCTSDLSQLLACVASHRQQVRANAGGAAAERGARASAPLLQAALLQRRPGACTTHHMSPLIGGCPSCSRRHLMPASSHLQDMCKQRFI